MKIADFFIELGVKPDLAALKNFQTQVNKIPQTLFSLKNAFTGLVVYGIDKFVEGTVNGTVALQNFNNQTDLSIQKLQEWQVAGQLSDISLTADQISNSISNLQKNLTNIRLGGGNLKPFQLLGIDVAGKDAFQVLEQVRESIKGLSAPMATNLIEQLGLSPKFINVLRTSKKEFDGLSQAKFLGKEQRDNILKLGTAITKFKINLGLAKDKIVSDLLPVWTNMLNLITHLFDGFQLLTGWVIDNKSAMVSLGVAIGVIFTAMHPLLALFGLIILALEDLYIYFKDGDSVIGKFIDKLNIIPETLNKIRKSLGLDDVDFSGMFKTLKEDAGKGVDAIKGFFGFGEDKKNLSDSPLKEDKKVKFDFSKLNLKDSVQKTLEPKTTSNNTNSNTTFNNNYNINSNGSPESVAGAIVDKQQTQLNYAYQDMNNGAGI